jgi:Mn2+/Fe2+ NRAMP family transporter
LVIIVSTLAGVAMDFLDINPVRALYWTTAINGLLAPVLLVAIIFIASSRAVMKDQPSSIPSVIVVSVATLLMFGAAIGMFVF